MVERHCAHAHRLAELIAREPGITVLNDVVLNQISVSFGSDEATKAVIARIQSDGTIFAGGAQWRDRWILRLSVISAPTTEADIDISADAVIAAWRTVQAESAKAPARSS